MFNQETHDALRLIDGRDYWKPFRYPELYNLAETHRKMNWTIEEVKKLGQDVKDWKTLDAEEKAIYEFLLLYFTQADVDVASSYFENLAQWYTQPEQRFWLAQTIQREATHVQCYDMLPDQFGIEKTKYSEMLDIDEVYNQREFMIATAEGGSAEERIYTLVKHLCGEGIGIYGIFLMLINAQRFGKMTCLGQEVVAWSARDENQHCEGLTWLFNQEIAENPALTKRTDLIENICEMFCNAVERGIALAKCAYAKGSLRDLSIDQIEIFLKQLANARISQLNIGVDKVYPDVTDEILPQVGLLFAKSSLVNFFEAASTNYSIGSLTGSWVYPDANFKTDHEIEQEILNG